MRARLQYLRYRLSASLWFVPGLLILAGMLLAFGMLLLDTLAPPDWIEPVQRLLRIGPEGARQVLATIAGSMITVASLVFSITLVVLTLASSQLGPRLINRFMRDPVNQAALGTFVGTFLYALLVLETVSETGPEPFVPYLSVALGLMLAVISLFWLIYFIHHVADSIQADSVIAEIAEALDEAIARRFPEVDAPQAIPLQAPFLDRLAEPAGIVAADRSGYIQAIDAQALLRRASAEDVLIKVDVRPGDFVVEDAALLLVWPRERLSDELGKTLHGAIVVGPKRTPTQDIDFAMGALVEIGLRALSPGINDPQTALTCIDRLTEGLVKLMRSDEPPSLVQDGDGALRLIARPATFENVLGAAFNPIRHAGRDHASVLRRQAEMLTLLVGFARNDEQRAALAEQAAAAEAVCRAADLDPLGSKELEQRLAELRRALASVASEGPTNEEGRR